MHRCWFDTQSLTSSLRLGIQKLMCMSHALYGGQPTVASGKLPQVPSRYNIMTVELSPQMFTARRMITEQVQPSARVRRGSQRSSSGGSKGEFSRQFGDGPLSIPGESQLEAVFATKTSIDFFEYAPAVFHNLRLLHGIGDIELADAFWMKDPSLELSKTICTRNNVGSAVSLQHASSRSSSSSQVPMDESPQKSQGKSAAVFIKSQDGRYLLKTVNDEERAVLLKMLPAYYRHMERHQGETLLPWFLWLGWSPHAKDGFLFR